MANYVLDYSGAQVNTKLGQIGLTKISSWPVTVGNNTQIVRIPTTGTNIAITSDMVVIGCQCAHPEYLSSSITWQSYNGYITGTGSCTQATTIDIFIENINEEIEYQT